MALKPAVQFGDTLGMAFNLPADASDETPARPYAVDLKLHDETIQALYGVSLRLQAAVGLVSEPDVLKGELTSAVRAIDNVIADLRDRIEDLTGQEHQPSGY